MEPVADARVWRWRVESTAPLPVEATVDAAHAIVAALNETARGVFGSDALPPDLHIAGAAERDEAGVEAHHHAFILPEDLDLDGLIDHVAVVLWPRLGAEGFTRRGLALLAACPGFWLGGADARLWPAGLSASCPLGFDQPARVWASLTPFLPALQRGEPDWQIARSLRRVGLPEPVVIERVAVETQSGGRRVAGPAFAPTGPARRRWERKPAFDYHRRRMAYWRIVFAEPAPGPLMLGGLSHFGLGRFAPMAEEED
jgi:CRISPR-associated protein Csb2